MTQIKGKRTKASALKNSMRNEALPRCFLTIWKVVVRPMRSCPPVLLHAPAGFGLFDAALEALLSLARRQTQLSWLQPSHLLTHSFLNRAQMEVLRLNTKIYSRFNCCSPLVREFVGHRPAELALLLGAGASKSSGVALASEMIEEWRTELFEANATTGDERARHTPHATGMTHGKPRQISVVAHRRGVFQAI